MLTCAFAIAPLVQLQMNRNATCQVLCTKELSYKEVLQFQSFIRTEYMVNWCVPRQANAALVFYLLESALL